MIGAGYSSRVAFAWDFRLIRSYYQQQGLWTGERAPLLLNCDLILYLIELLENALSRGNNNGLLSVLFDSPFIPKKDMNDMDLS